MKVEAKVCSDSGCSSAHVRRLLELSLENAGGVMMFAACCSASCRVVTTTGEPSHEVRAEDDRTPLKPRGRLRGTFPVLHLPSRSAWRVLRRPVTGLWHLVPRPGLGSCLALFVAPPRSARGKH